MRLAGIVMDSHGNLFVSDIGWNAIKKITPAGVVSYFAGDMYGNPGNTNGTGTNARFQSPVGLAIDANDNIYVDDDFNDVIRKITPSGVVSTFAGSGAPARRMEPVHQQVSDHPGDSLQVRMGIYTLLIRQITMSGRLHQRVL